MYRRYTVHIQLVIIIIISLITIALLYLAIIFRKCLSQMVQSDWLLGGPLFLIETSQSFRGLLWRSIICSLHAFNIFYTIIHGMLSNIYFIHAQVHRSHSNDDAVHH